MSTSRAIVDVAGAVGPYAVGIAGVLIPAWLRRGDRAHDRALAATEREAAKADLVDRLYLQILTVITPLKYLALAHGSIGNSPVVDIERAVKTAAVEVHVAGQVHTYAAADVLPRWDDLVASLMRTHTGIRSGTPSGHEDVLGEWPILEAARAELEAAIRRHATP